MEIIEADSTSLTQHSIEHELRTLGVARNMRLMTHSSLSSFGHVEGGAATIVRALMNIVGPEGLLLFPSFNHGDTFGPDFSQPFDPHTTKTTNGAIPDAFWRMPGVRRSLDPTHAFAAWGADAERYVAQHHRTLTMGAQSPLGLLLADGGSCLLLGVDYDRNTFHHVVETVTGAPCLGKRCEAYPVQLPNARIVAGRTWGWRNGVCPITDMNRYGRIMHARDLDRRSIIGECHATLFALRDCLTVVSELLRDGLDDIPPCTRCPIRPRTMSATVESDWDEDTQQPRADSTCWTY
ncbi:MAG: AAC(3) family N-acetyltransferase [Chloroflexi bacterium]|nr:AAC(3) family N-acetyltransferase [Chloroflexota bacterium]